ncbi:hypothetical protein [Duganella sp. BuS-21]|uniref:hypothetical protein n=1 Tax=Duganella sp. BuS-21 TaxID=2943848 RepID=UPI0035A5B887
MVHAAVDLSVAIATASILHNQDQAPYAARHSVNTAIVASYRPTLTAHGALRDMLLEARTTLDTNLVSLVIRELGIYPIGTYVRMLNGEVGVVTRRGLQSTTPHVESVIGPRGAALD